MMSVSSDSAGSARFRIRARLLGGLLPPHTEHQKMFGGYGEDQVCDCCDRRISSTEVAYEIEPATSMPLRSSFPRTLAMHLECFEIWAIESRSINSELSERRVANHSG